MAFRKDNVMSNRVAGCLAVGAGRNGGQELTIASLQAILMAQDMVVVGDARPTQHRGATLWNNWKDDITKDEFGMQTAKNLGKRVAEVAMKMVG
jgi:multimeric flavodoxin WrbA